MSYFSVDIYTPSRVLEKNVPVESLTISTCRGEIQILPEHTHLITKLETGVLTLRQKDKENYYLVTKGICKILGNKVLILSKTSEKAENIDEQSAKEMLLSVQQRVTSGVSISEEEYDSLSQKYQEAQTRIKLTSLKKS